MLTRARCCLAFFLLALQLAVGAEPGPLRSVVTPENLDIAHCEEFPDNPQPFRHGGWKRGLLGALHVRGPMQPHSHWTTDETEKPVVYLRIAFKQALPVGCIIGANGWEVSTLNADAAPPGDVKDDAQWEVVPEVAGQAGLRVLTLPHVRTTRAIRLKQTRKIEPGEKWRGRMAGVLILRERLYTLTPEAVAHASSEAVSNQKERELHGVQNLVSGGRWVAGRGEPITPETPQWVALVWEKPRAIRGIGVLNAFAKRVAFDVYEGPNDIHPLTAAPEKWREVTAADPPIWWRPIYTDFYIDLGRVHETRALRMRILEPLTTENGDIRYRTKGKRDYTSLGGLMVMTDLGERPIPERKQPELDTPPVLVRYEMPFDGKVAVAINDAEGNRVRNLIGDASRKKGPNVEAWDGLDDGGNLVPPGPYTVKTIAHEPLSLRWQMTPHNARDLPWKKSPSWGGIHGPGSFLSDHATPTSVCVFGEGADSRVFIGASIAEAGHSLVALDLDGKKVWGTKWLDTAGASHLATDGRRLYVGAEGGWIRNTVMLFRLDPQTYRHERLVQFRKDPARGITGNLSGLAVREGELYAAFNAPPRGRLGSALSPTNLAAAEMLPPEIARGRDGSGTAALARLLRTGGSPDPHHSLRPRLEGDRAFLRITFSEPQPVGTLVLPACGAEFSALERGAPFPGDPAEEAHWVPLASETAGRVQVVTAPPELATRALRVTWKRAGTPLKRWRPSLPGLKVLGHRFESITPAAELTGSSGKTAAGGLWRSATRKEDNLISPLSPAELMLTWPKPQFARGLALINPFAGRIEVSVRTDGKWRPAGRIDPPVWWRPSYHDAWHDFGKLVKLDGLRLSVTRALTSENPDVHRHTGGRPRYCSIDAVVVLSPVGGDPQLPPDLSQRISVYSAADGKLRRQLKVPAPRGLAFDRQGRLMAVSDGQVVYVDPATGTCKPLVAAHLEEPFDVAVGRDGTLYVSDGGEAHQVKVFSADGRFVRAIGKPGGRMAGPYDPRRMSNPRGIDVDARGQIWVAEAEYQPKRISWWRVGDGAFLGEKMGPARYGGGGWLDPHDISRFYYGGMEFALDWEQGSWELKQVLWRGSGLPAGAPERPIHYGGKRYLVTDPGHQYGRFALVTEHRDEHLVPLAMAGMAESWPLLRTAEFMKAIGVDITGKGFLWVDANGDGRPQPGEIELGPALKAAYFTSFMGDDLTLNYQTIQLPPAGLNACGAPAYSFDRLVKRKPMPVRGTYSVGRLPGGALFGVTSPITMVDAEDRVLWTYPEDYLGVHASHRAPRPTPGECAGSLLYLGHAKADGDIGRLMGIVSNFGYYTLFTEDGLLAARLFHDYRLGYPGWYTDRAERGMEVGHFSLGGEHFYGSFTRAANGRYYVVAGHNHSSIVEVRGLETLTRSTTERKLTREEFIACEAYARRRALLQVKKQAPNFVRAPRLTEFRADGKLDEWPKSQGARIHDVGQARIAWDKDRLLLAWEVKDQTPLLNTGKQPRLLFKTGDSVDLQIATDPAAPADRMKPSPGDVRLLITVADEKPVAVLYRHRVPGTAEAKVHLFSSPWRTVKVDEIQVLRDLAIGVRKTRGGYTVEAGVALARLGLEPRPGMRIRADFGVLRGDPKGEETRERLYWANMVTNIITDIPSEIQLCPALWGTVLFE